MDSKRANILCLLRVNCWGRSISVAHAPTGLVEMEQRRKGGTGIHRTVRWPARTVCGRCSLFIDESQKWNTFRGNSSNAVSIHEIGYRIQIQVSMKMGYDEVCDLVQGVSLLKLGY